MNERKRTARGKDRDDFLKDDDVSNASGRLGAVDNDFSIFDKVSLESVCPMVKEQYLAAEPFPYFLVRHIVPVDLTDWIHRDFPSISELKGTNSAKEVSHNAFSYDNSLRMPASLRRLFKEMSMPVFLNFLEDSTGIKGLIPDPYLEEAGVLVAARDAEIWPVEKVNEKHSKLDVYRRLRVEISFDQNWNQEWGGQLEFRQLSFTDEPDKSFPVQFGQLICYDVLNSPPSGYAKLTCPGAYTRKIVSSYFYTANKN